MGRKLLGLGATAVLRLACGAVLAVAWCAPGTAAADAAVPATQMLDKAAYDNPNGNTHVVCMADSSQSYELYIPSSVPTTGSAPIFYGFDPGGNGKSTLLTFANAAAANGWILAVSNNSMNGPWSIIFAAQDAVIRDTEARLNLSPTRRFAGGMSGGGRTGLALAFRYPSKICGVLPLGAGWPTNTTLEPSTDALNVYMIVGTQDSNYTQDIPDTQGKLVDYGIRCVVKTFNGGHVWPPADMIMAGCQWLNKNAEVDPNSGLPPADCPTHSLFCQPPTALTEQQWASLISDTASQQAVYENFQGAALPITRVDWWGITAVDNSYTSHWLPCDPPADRFIISLHPDSGGVPGPALHQETVTAIREDLPHLYLRNYPLRHYHVTLSAPVTLPSGWVRVQQVRDARQYVFLLDSQTGDGQYLLRSDAEGDVFYYGDLAVSLSTEEMAVELAVSQDWGKPPLTVQFRASVAENVMAIREWKWDFGDGSVEEDINIPNPVHTYDHEGSYTVSLTVSTQISSAAVTRRNFIVVSHTLPLATPGALGALLAAFILTGAVLVRVKRRRTDL